MDIGALGNEIALLWCGIVCGTRSGRRDFRRLIRPTAQIKVDVMQIL